MNIFLDVLFVALVVYFIFAIRRSMRMSKASVALIEKYENDKRNPQLIDDIIAALNSDTLLSRILKQHNATRHDIARLQYFRPCTSGTMIISFIALPFY